MSRCPLFPDSHTTHEVESLRMNKHEMPHTIGMKRMIINGKRRLHSLLFYLISKSSSLKYCNCKSNMFD